MAKVVFPKFFKVNCQIWENKHDMTLLPLQCHASHMSPLLPRRWHDLTGCIALPCLVRSSDPFTTMLYSAPKHCCDSQWPPSPLMCSRSHTHTRQSLHFKPSDRVNADAGESRRVCKWRSTGLQHLILVEQWTFPELNILKVQLVLDFWIQIEAKEAEAL